MAEKLLGLYAMDTRVEPCLGANRTYEVQTHLNAQQQQVDNWRWVVVGGWGSMGVGGWAGGWGAGSKYA